MFKSCPSLIFFSSFFWTFTLEPLVAALCVPGDAPILLYSSLPQETPVRVYHKDLRNVYMEMDHLCVHSPRKWTSIQKTLSAQSTPKSESVDMSCIAVTNSDDRSESQTSSLCPRIRSILELRVADVLPPSLHSYVWFLSKSAQNKKPKEPKTDPRFACGASCGNRDRMVPVNWFRSFSVIYFFFLPFLLSRWLGPNLVCAAITSLAFLVSDYGLFQLTKPLTIITQKVPPVSLFTPCLLSLLLRCACWAVNLANFRTASDSQVPALWNTFGARLIYRSVLAWGTYWLPRKIYDNVNELITGPTSFIPPGVIFAV